MKNYFTSTSNYLRQTTFDQISIIKKINKYELILNPSISKH